ncbi:MAG TPA: hypothetical protein VG651_10500 [Stellaceae bacterium]|nr:hypothetical protein [Stellaceae bacterium]
MSRLGGAFWFILVIASGMTNFLVKQTVQGLDEQLTAVKKKTIAEQKAIHELTADWTFLNQPELLANLNTRYMHLVPVAPRQIVASVDAIPLRPAPPPPPPEPAPLLAAAPPAAIAPAPAAFTPPPPPPAIPASAPVIPVSATMPAPVHAVAAPHPPPPVHIAAAPRPSAPRPAKPASLDALFAQVTGDR